MRNAHQLFARLSGEQLSYRDLRRKLSELLAEDTTNIPAEISLTELLEVAQANHWITKTEHDKYEVNVAGAVKAA
jgi:hypothetical protein